jgi:anti-sigma factor RsiW
MNCETLLTYLSDYIDNNLDEDLTAEAEEHLATCRNCSVMLDSTQKMILLARQNGKRQIPIERREKLYNQIAAAFAKRDQETL